MTSGRGDMRAHVVYIGPQYDYPKRPGFVQTPNIFDKDGKVRESMMVRWEWEDAGKVWTSRAFAFMTGQEGVKREALHTHAPVLFSRLATSSIQRISRTPLDTRTHACTSRAKRKGHTNLSTLVPRVMQEGRQEGDHTGPAV